MKELENKNTLQTFSTEVSYKIFLRQGTMGFKSILLRVGIAKLAETVEQIDLERITTYRVDKNSIIEFRWQ
jgi:hypothetical protein